MIIKPSDAASSRRDFLMNILPAGTMFCLACGHLPAWAAGLEAQKAVEKKHKFQEDAGLSYERVFGFAIKGTYVPMLQGLSRRLEGVDFIELLKAVTHEKALEAGRQAAERSPLVDFASYREARKKAYASSPFMSHIVTYTITEDSEKALEWKFTECLYAKIFREANAADIGYATVCYGDLGRAEALRPKIRLILTKTLMQGHDCCNHRYVWEG